MQGGLTCIEGPPGPPDKGEGTLVKDGVQDVGWVPVSVAAEHGLPICSLGSLRSPSCVNKQRQHLCVLHITRDQTETCHMCCKDAVLVPCGHPAVSTSSDDICVCCISHDIRQRHATCAARTQSWFPAVTPLCQQPATTFVCVVCHIRSDRDMQHVLPVRSLGFLQSPICVNKPSQHLCVTCHI